MRRYYSLYGRVLSKQRLYEAFRHVKRNKGAAGIDGQSLSTFEANLEAELSCLLLELKEKVAGSEFSRKPRRGEAQGCVEQKRYRAQPVKRAVIAKEDGGERLLGIPTVRDRVVQQALRSIIEPLFEPDFARPIPGAHRCATSEAVLTRSCGLVTHRVTGIVRAVVVITQLAKRRCSSVTTGVNGSWTWICRNASTP